jgi:pilus assembly protein Flp/PilA
MSRHASGGVKSVPFFRQLRRNIRGATAIEYALMLAMVAMAMLTVINSLGFTLSGVFETISNAMTGA